MKDKVDFKRDILPKIIMFVLTYLIMWLIANSLSETQYDCEFYYPISEVEVLGKQCECE